MTLQKQINAVHAARMMAGQAKTLLDTERSDWETAYAASIAKVKELTEGVGVAEAVLREMALKVYEETGSKAPAPGVGIRVVSEIDYSTDDATAWASANMPLLLVIDKRPFERFAKENPGRVSVATITERATATIAPDLSKFVEDVPRAPAHPVPLA